MTRSDALEAIQRVEANQEMKYGTRTIKSLPGQAEEEIQTRRIQAEFPAEKWKKVGGASSPS